MRGDDIAYRKATNRGAYSGHVLGEEIRIVIRADQNCPLERGVGVGREITAIGDQEGIFGGKLAHDANEPERHDLTLIVARCL